MIETIRELSPYYNEKLVRDAVERGDHREAIGGKWDEIGKLQFEFLKEQGLQPCHTLLDIGCGSFRGGVHFATFLDSGRYFGIDISQALIDAGYERELRPRGLDIKVPRTNILRSADFEFEGLRQHFDFAIALSVFTHLPMNSIRVCLEKLFPWLQTGSCLFASFFLCADSASTWQAQRHEPGGITTFGDRDPYHYRSADLEYIAAASGWRLREHLAFDHPRNQRMAVFERR